MNYLFIIIMLIILYLNTVNSNKIVLNLKKTDSNKIILKLRRTDIMNYYIILKIILHFIQNIVY